MRDICNSTENINDVIMESDQKSIVMFWSETCGPCKIMKPAIQKIEDAENEVKFFGVNTSTVDGMDLAKANMIRSVPTIQFIKDGEVKFSVSGSANKDQIESLINKLKEA